MLIASESAVVSGGRVLYRDDQDPALLHALPSRLVLAGDPPGAVAFTLLYYQEDFPERGARLVATFAPEFPAISPEAVPGPRGARVEPVAFGGGEAWLSWAGLEAGAAVVSELSAAGVRVELGLSRDEARALREALAAGAETVRVRVRLGYELGRRPVPLRARVDLAAVHASLSTRFPTATLTGAQLRAALLALPAGALRVEPAGGARPAAAVPEETAAVLAPFVAARVAAPGAAHTLFDFTPLTLRRPEEVADASLVLDLSRARGWQGVWEGEWSLSAFHRQARDAGRLGAFFPEVLALPAVGEVQLLVENLLPLDGRCLDQVLVRVLSRRLGSLEEDVFEVRYRADSGAVARRPIPQIAFRPFSYRYEARARLVGNDPSGADAEWVPQRPELRIGTEPILRIGSDLLPFVLCHVSAEPAVFDQAPRVSVELSAAGDGPPAPVRTAVLTRSAPYRWIPLPPEPFAARALRWRALLHATSAGDGQVVAGAWQAEGDLRARVTRVHAHPREPVRVAATATFQQVPEVERIECQLCSGCVDPGLAAPDLSAVFVHDETRELVVWPRSIFDEGISFRYGIEVSGVGTLWTDWRHAAEPRITMSVEDDFYRRRTVTASVRAPWSERASPDPDATAGEIIYAELHVRVGGAGGTERTLRTFDRSNAGTEVRWTYRARAGAERYAYDVEALTADGRIVTFGPFETDADRLSLEIYRTRVGDTEPAEFGLRSV